MELLAKKHYGLTVSPTIFAEKTWRTGIASLVQDNGYITIDRITPNDFEDIAHVIDGSFEYEIPSSEWKWFKEVNPDDGVVSEIEVKSDPKLMSAPEETPAISFVDTTGGSLAVDIEKLNIPKFKFKQQESPTESLLIDCDYAKNFKELRIREPLNKSGMYTRFLLQHLFNGGSIYQIDMESSIDLQEEAVAKLFGLHSQLEAIDNLELLVKTERTRIAKELKPFEKKNESRNLRNTRKSS